jgi:uncharacterized protein (TIGR00725 family)
MNYRRTQIGVIGGRVVDANVLTLAEEVGRELAKRDAILVCGGMGGVMEAACRGAKIEGGTTVGILPVSSADEGNAYLDVVVPSGLGVARNAVIINACHGVIAVGGKYGTLSEIAFALHNEIPVVSLASWEVNENVIKATTAEEAVEKLFKMLKRN